MNKSFLAIVSSFPYDIESNRLFLVIVSSFPYDIESNRLKNPSLSISKVLEL
jgi:hypothetical protein